jgi:hypothetical protein
MRTSFSSDAQLAAFLSRPACEIVLPPINATLHSSTNVFAPHELYKNHASRSSAGLYPCGQAPDRLRDDFTACDEDLITPCMLCGRLIGPGRDLPAALRADAGS